MPPVQTTHAMPPEFSTNGVDSLYWDDSFLRSMFDISEPINAPTVESYHYFQAAITTQQYSNQVTNEFQAQGESEETDFPISRALQTLQTLGSPSDSDGRFPLPQPSLSQPQLPIPLQARKRMRGDPAPNEQGQYACTYEGCTKEIRLSDSRVTGSKWLLVSYTPIKTNIIICYAVNTWTHTKESITVSILIAPS